jgi:hypothetical protein
LRQEESKNIDGDSNMRDEEEESQEQSQEIKYDENQITEVISRFFMQTSEARLKYMNGFKDLLQAHLKK